MVSQVIDQWSFTSPFEGVIPHLYKDTAGYITAGVGFMLPNLAAAQKLPWEPPRDIALDWQEVSQLEAGKPASFYRPHTRARLPLHAMRTEFAWRMAALDQPLGALFPGFRSYPQAVQIALRDMAYNLGIRGLSKFARLRAACAGRDWAAAAGQCNRRGIQQARNQATVDAFLSAV